MIKSVFNSLRRRWTMFRVNKIYKGVKHFERKRRLLNSIGYDIGEGTKIVGPVEIYGSLTVGKNCWIGKNLKVNGNGKVIIGDNCDIAPEVTFQTGGHKIGNPERRAGDGCNFTQEVGSGCWICGRVTILNDIKIGNSSVVAGCACVTESVDENTLVGGFPAKVIKKLND